MSDDKRLAVRDAFLELATPDGMQRFFLGTKKNGQPRAVYDVVKHYTSTPKEKKGKGKGKKHGDDSSSIYSFYLNTKGGKKKKKKKKAKHWHI